MDRLRSAISQRSLTARTNLRREMVRVSRRSLHLERVFFNYGTDLNVSINVSMIVLVEKKQGYEG